MEEKKPEPKFLEKLKKDKEEKAMTHRHFLLEGKQSVNKRIERPEIPFIDPSKEDFDFFCLDIDHHTDKPPKYMSDKMLLKEQ